MKAASFHSVSYTSLLFSPPKLGFLNFLSSRVCVCVYQCVWVTQSCPTLCDPMDCSPPGFSVHGILQARVLEWVAISLPGDLPDPGIELESPSSPTLQADSSLLSHQGSLLWAPWLYMNKFTCFPNICLFGQREEKNTLCFLWLTVSLLFCTKYKLDPYNSQFYGWEN